MVVMLGGSLKGIDNPNIDDILSSVSVSFDSILFISNLRLLVMTPLSVSKLGR
ncbi:MAG: hypothetical protein ACJAWQ_000682 [Paraglaciecola sp.]|jgi:hypothetical protein